MPIEHRPAKPRPQGVPPYSRVQAHKVHDDETLGQVARKYRVSEHHLLLHNFGTTNPAEINWYLRERVGCVLTTHDKKNWRFSSKANPGLIYIPVRIIQGPPIVMPGHIAGQPKLLDIADSTPAEFLPGTKFGWEVKIPKKDELPLGKYLLWKMKIGIEGVLAPPKGMVKYSVKKDQLKLALEYKIINAFKGSIAAKLDQKALQELADDIKSGTAADKGSWKKFVASLFDASVKKTWPLGTNVSIT